MKIWGWKKVSSLPPLQNYQEIKLSRKFSDWMYTCRVFQLLKCLFYDSLYIYFFQSQEWKGREDHHVMSLTILGCFRFAQNCRNFCMWPSILPENITLRFFGWFMLSFQGKQGQIIESVKFDIWWFCFHPFNWINH